MRSMLPLSWLRCLPWCWCCCCCCCCCWWWLWPPSKLSCWCDVVDCATPARDEAELDEAEAAELTTLRPLPDSALLVVEGTSIVDEDDGSGRPLRVAAAAGRHRKGCKRSVITPVNSAESRWKLTEAGGETRRRISNEGSRVCLSYATSAIRCMHFPNRTKERSREKRTCSSSAWYISHLAFTIVASDDIYEHNPYTRRSVQQPKKPRKAPSSLSFFHSLTHSLKRYKKRKRERCKMWRKPGGRMCVWAYERSSGSILAALSRVLSYDLTKCAHRRLRTHWAWGEYPPNTQIEAERKSTSRCSYVLHCR